MLIHRSDLRRILLDACRDSCVNLQNGVFVQKAEADGVKVRAFAANGDVYGATLCSLQTA
ncbi:hypothetical protein AS189_12465 [Arthrobacter alpinus]|uniref:Uncharacterized protein n=1 Tax=Arthrobacter alpinus TaxID=656366 RepID=A0A0S2M0J9_9MICC|nr:hypothetical protein AS189_12465 [Arthrobacter alpinus]